MNRTTRLPVIIQTLKRSHRWLSAGLVAFFMSCSDSPLLQLEDYLAEELGNLDDIEDIVLAADFTTGVFDDWIMGEHNYDWKTGTPSDCSDPGSQTGCLTTTFTFEEFDTTDFEDDVTAEDPNEYTIYDNNLFSRELVADDNGKLVADYSDVHNTTTSAGHDSALVLPSYGMRHGTTFSSFQPTEGQFGRDLVIRFKATLPINEALDTSDKIIITLTSNENSSVTGDTGDLATAAVNEFTGSGIALVLESLHNDNAWGRVPVGSGDPAYSGLSGVMFRVERLRGKIIENERFNNDAISEADSGVDVCGVPGTVDLTVEGTRPGSWSERQGLVGYLEYFGGIFLEGAPVGSGETCNDGTIHVVGNPPVAQVLSEEGKYEYYSDSNTDALFLNNNSSSSISPIDYLPTTGRYFSPNYADDSNVGRTALTEEENPDCDEDSTADECFYEDNNGYVFVLLDELEEYEMEVIIQADGLITVKVGETLVENADAASGEIVEAGELRGFVDNNIDLFEDNIQHVSVKYHTLTDPATAVPNLGMEYLNISIK